MNDVEIVAALLDRAEIKYTRKKMEDSPHIYGRETIIVESNSTTKNDGYVGFYTTFTFVNGELLGIGAWE